MGGIVVLLRGYKFPKIGKYPCYESKPLMKLVIIPALVGMIFMGFISRNFFGSFMNAYPSTWTPWMRNICLSVILMRGGFGVFFRG